MAKQDQKATRTSIDDLNETLSTFEQKVENNKKYIYYALAAVLVVAALVFGYIYGIRGPQEQAAKTEISQADESLMAGNDSVALAQYQEIANKFSNKVGNRAALNAAILLYQKGKYEDAITYLKKYDANGVLVGPASYSLLGDCYVNLKNYDEALSAFDKAINASDANPLYTPVFLLKKATVLHEMANYKAEAEVYQTIKDKYAEFTNSSSVDVDKYLERAKALAE